MARWRHSFYKLVPSWLSTGDGEKVLYTLGRLTDGFVERARQSLTARFPTYTGPTGLRLLGDERGIIQGRGEDLAGYARRLHGWRGTRGHQVRGSAYALLRQVWHYFGGIKAQTVDNGGNVFTVEHDGTESATHGGVWDWDGNADWWRFWLKLVPGDDQMTAHATVGSGPWGNSFVAGRGYTVGQTNVTPADARVIKNLFRGDHPWKPAGTKEQWLIVVLGQDEAHAPDGTWRYFTDAGLSVRYPGWRYWNLRKL